MVAIIAGGFLWLFVIASLLFGINLGATPTVILLSLGAVLVASYAIQSIKVSATGFELKTRDQPVTPVQIKISAPKFPRIDYLRLVCWLAILSPAILIFYASFFADIQPWDIDQTVLIWFLLFAAIGIVTLVVRWIRKHYER
jgi:hypothetical protein